MRFTPLPVAFAGLALAAIAGCSGGGGVTSLPHSSPAPGASASPAGSPSPKISASPAASPSASPSASASPSTSSTQTLAASGATVALPASNGVTGASVVFPPASNLPSGVSVVFNSSNALMPPSAQSTKRRRLSASTTAFWQMTFTGSTAQDITFAGNITVSIPTPAGVSGTGMVFEVFDGSSLAATCAPSMSGNTTTFTCTNPHINLGDTYWLEVVAGSALSTASCIVPVAASPAGPHLLYYTDGGNNVVDSFDVCAQPASGFTATYTLPAGTLSTTGTSMNPGEIRFDRGSAAGDPRVFVVGANDTLVYLDVSTTPGTVLQTITYSATPHHLTATNGAEGAPEYLLVTIGNDKLISYQVSQTPPYLTPVASIATLSSPRGVGVEGSTNGVRNDPIVANTGNGTVDAINSSTLGAGSLTVDSTLALTSAPEKVTGPNAGLNCVLVADATNDSISAVSIAGPGGTIRQIGTPIPLPAAPTYDTFFPPGGNPGTGSAGYGSNTGIVTYAGGATLVTCDGTNFTVGPTWTTFPTASGLAASNYSSTAINSLLYVVGTSNGTPVLQGYTATQDTPLFSATLASGVVPQDVTAGP